MSTKLVVDALALLSPLTGIGRYTSEVTSNIKKNEEFDITLYYGYYSKEILSTATINKSKVKKLKNIVAKTPLLKKFARKAINVYSKYYMYNKEFDIYWQPNFIPNMNIKAKNVVTSVHDFSFMLYKDFHPKERIEFFNKYFFKNIQRSDIILTGSHFTKEEILKYIKIDHSKVEVIYHGIRHDIFRKYDCHNITLDLPAKFLLCVGSLEPRKNLIRLLKAYELLPSELKEEYHLVLIGFSGWENSEILQLINKNKKYIHYLGFVSDEELAMVYNMATIFIYPSLYEGFGLPPIEAMACGVPVITSSNTSMEEICMDNVVYVNPYDIEDIKSKIELLLLDDIYRYNISTKGILHAQQFTWERSALKHSQVFNMF